MEYAKLGSTGVKVSRICLGTMQFGWSCNEEMAQKIMNRAWDEGINFFDTANIYTRRPESYPGKSEEIIGRWLKSSGNREDLILATKVRGTMGDVENNQGLSRRHIIKALDQSLRRLQTDWVDLYQSHWPDLDTPIKETLQIYTDLISEMKINYAGASNYQAWRLVESLWVADKYSLARYETIQPYYSLVRRHRYDDELRDVCLKYGIGVIPYSPLAGGFLTGKYRRDQSLPESARAESNKNRYFSDRGFKILEELENITENKGVTITQGALAWTLARPGITSPIFGVNNLDQLEDVLLAIDVTFTNEELEHLEEISSLESNMFII